MKKSYFFGKKTGFPKINNNKQYLLNKEPACQW